jgi:hypothetical protein
VRYRQYRSLWKQPYLISTSWFSHMNILMTRYE